MPLSEASAISFSYRLHTHSLPGILKKEGFRVQIPKLAKKADWQGGDDTKPEVGVAWAPLHL